MKAKRVNPAVYAGLLTTAMSVLPLPAQALTESDGSINWGPFAMGVGTGVAITGIVSAIAWHNAKRNLVNELKASEENEELNQTDAYMPQHLCEPGDRPKTYVYDADDPELEVDDGPQSESVHGAHHKTPESDPDGQDATVLETTPEQKSVSADYHGAHFNAEAVASSEAESSREEEPQSQQDSTGNKSQVDVLNDRIPQMEQVDDWVKSASTDETTDFLRAAQMRSSYVKQHPKPKSAGHGAHSSDDYGDIATNYVKRRTWSQRMQERAHGVAEVLADRLGHDPMEDVPVITRADGTVGDIGTGWWHKAMGNDISGPMDIDIDDNYSVVQQKVDDIPFQDSVASAQQTFAQADAEAAEPSPQHFQHQEPEEGVPNEETVVEPGGAHTVATPEVTPIETEKVETTETASVEISEPEPITEIGTSEVETKTEAEPAEAGETLEQTPEVAAEANVEEEEPSEAMPEQEAGPTAEEHVKEETEETCEPVAEAEAEPAGEEVQSEVEAAEEMPEVAAEEQAEPTEEASSGEKQPRDEQEEDEKEFDEDMWQSALDSIDKRDRQEQQDILDSQIFPYVVTSSNSLDDTEGDLFNAGALSPVGNNLDQAKPIDTEEHAAKHFKQSAKHAQHTDQNDGTSESEKPEKKVSQDTRDLLTVIDGGSQRIQPVDTHRVHKKTHRPTRLKHLTSRYEHEREQHESQEA